MRAGRRILLLLLAAWAAGSGGLFPESRSLQDCLELGLRNSKALRAAQLRLQALGAAYLEARDARLPSLALAARYSRLSPLAAGRITLPDPIGPISLFPAIEDTFALSASLQQPLWSGLRIRSAIAQARAAREEAALSYQQQRQELAYQVQAAFWELAKADEALRVFDENIARVNAHLREIQDFYDQGLVTYNEVLQARMRLAQTTLRRLEAGNTRALLQAHLAILIGLPVDALIEPAYRLGEEAGPGAQTPAEGDPAGAQAGAGAQAASGSPAGEPDRGEDLAALERRPEVGAARQRLAAAQAAVTAARSGWYPSVFLTGGYQYALPNPRQFPPEPEFTGTWDLGIAASLDVGRWPAAARRGQQALAQAGQAREALGQLQDSILLEVLQARLTLDKDAQRVGVARQLVAQAEENRKIISERHSSGLALASELLDAETARLEADLELSQARIDLEIARAALARALGR
jgi:outer membrane protein